MSRRNPSRGDEGGTTSNDTEGSASSGGGDDGIDMAEVRTEYEQNVKEEFASQPNRRTPETTEQPSNQERTTEISRASDGVPTVYSDAIPQDTTEKAKRARRGEDVKPPERLQGQKETLVEKNFIPRVEEMVRQEAEQFGLREAEPGADQAFRAPEDATERDRNYAVPKARQTLEQAFREPEPPEGGVASRLMGDIDGDNTVSERERASIYASQQALKAYGEGLANFEGMALDVGLGGIATPPSRRR